MKAFLYIRVSTDEQAEKGYSQRSQEEVLRRYCDFNNIDPIGTYIEDFSAKTFARPAFTSLLKELKHRKHTGAIILFTKWDRFSRNAADAYSMISTLRKLGVEPQAVEQPINLDIPENKIMLAFYLASPEVENDRRSLNIFFGMRRAKKEGRWLRKAPKGYNNILTPDGKKMIAPDPQCEEIIKYIFSELAKKTYSIDSVFKEARLRGFKCSQNYFYRLVRNPVYCGKIVVPAYKDEPEILVPGLHSAIISEDLFYRTQEALDNKKSSYTYIVGNELFPLRGFLLCPSCGKNLTASTSTGKTGKHSYYHCSSPCRVRFRARDVNEELVSELRFLQPKKEILELYRSVVADVFSRSGENGRREIKNLTKQVKQLAERRDKALDLLLQEKIDSSDFDKIRKESEQKTAILEGKLSSFTQVKPDLEEKMNKAIYFMNNLEQLYVKSSVLKKRQIISSMFPEKLIFTKNGYRTPMLNEAVRLIFNVGEAFSKIKNGTSTENSEMCREVERTGIEPVIPP